MDNPQHMMTLKKLSFALLMLTMLLVGGPTRAEGKLTIWWERGSDKMQDDAWSAVIQRFETRYKVKVALTLFATQEILPKLAAALAAGNPPDVGFGNVLDLQATAIWAHDDKLEDISSVIDPIRNRFDPAALATVFLYDGITQNRAYYAFPVQQQTMHIQYWSDMLLDAGLKESDIPGNWDAYWDFWCSTVQDAYRKRTGNRVYGLGLPMGVDASTSTMAFLTFLDAYNVKLVDAVGKLLVDDPAVRAGLIGAMTSYTQPYLRGCTPPSSTHWQDVDNGVAFLNRATVMTPTTSISIAARSMDDGNHPSSGAEQNATARNKRDERIRITGFPRKPDAGTMVYRASVKTGVLFKEASNKQVAKQFVRFLLEDAQLTPYVESARGRWFPVMTAAQQSPFWRSDPARRAVYQQFMQGTIPFEVTSNYRFALLNNENVWAKAMQRVVNDKISVAQAVDELITRIKAVAGP